MYHLFSSIVNFGGGTILDKLYVFASFSLMLVTASLMYRWYIKPALNKLEPDLHMQLLLVVHCFRFISPISLVAGVTVPGLPYEFTIPQVVGDVGTAFLALITIANIRGGKPSAMAWVWFCNLFGLADLIMIGVQGARFDFFGHVGGMFYVVAWFVPWLLVSHVAILVRLVKPSGTSRARG